MNHFSAVYFYARCAPKLLSLSLSSSLSNVLGGAYVRACCVRLQIKQVHFVVQLLRYLIVSQKLCYLEYTL